MADISYVLTISILLLVALAPRFSLQQQCRSPSDRGRTECVLLTPYYNVYQWATCLAESYIMRVNENHHCRSATVTQCYYQCMIEIHGIDEGPVYSDCRCSPGEVLPNRMLEAECYSPPGDDCGWYADCLERRYPCSGTDDGYAIEYAQKFCSAYSDNYNDFSPIGRQWIDRVRRCLQLALVPSLRLWVSNTCADIRKQAFASHSPCYTEGMPSMCELNCTDVWRAFVVVNFPGGNYKEGALVTAPVSTISQMLSVMLSCFTHEELGCGIKDLTTTLRMVVRFEIRNRPIIRTATTAYRVADYFGKKLSWLKNGIRWFPLFNDDDDDDDDSSGNRKKRQITDEVSIRILLVDTKLLNISNGTMSQPPSRQNIDQAIDSLVDAVRNGLLSRIPLNLNNTEVISSLSMVGQCMDIDCNSTNVTELAIAPPDSGTEIIHLHYLTLFTAFAGVLLMK